jgi:hypothetical protein
MTEKSLRNIIYKILLEDEMGKWLVKGLKKAHSLETGDFMINKNDEEKKIKKPIFSSMLFNPSSKSDFKNKLNFTQLEKELKKINISDSKKRKDVINLFLNLNRFFADSTSYDFEKNLINIKEKEIFDSFVAANINEIYKEYRDKFILFTKRWDSGKVTKEIKNLENYIS